MTSCFVCLFNIEAASIGRAEFLEPDILEAIEKMGFEEPTEIQKKAIPYILESEQDLIALAQTGTGKTGAFGLSCLQKIQVEEKIPQMIVLAPTRELALQTARELKKFSKKNQGFSKNKACFFAPT